LSALDIAWRKEAAVCVVMASGGYPGKFAKGAEISGLQDAAKQGAVVFHAGTAEKNGSVVTNGGRVLGVTALGETIKTAVDKVYHAVEDIHFSEVHYRKDIAYRAIRRLDGK
jgi:phosphoribosylamine--glycine ligase